MAAHRTCAKHRKGFAGTHFERIDHGPGAGLYAAGERTQQLQRHVLRYLDDIALVAQGVAGKRRLPEKIAVDRLAITGQATAAIDAGAEKVMGKELVAVGGCLFQATGALAAGVEGHDHMIADGHLADGPANPFDHTGTFVAEDHRRRGRQQTVAHHDVGVTDAGSHHPHQDLSIAGLLQVQSFDIQRCFWCSTYGSFYFHTFSPTENGVKTDIPVGYP